MKPISYAFRITHIDNIPHILKYGIVRADSPYRNQGYVSIGNPDLIQFRKSLNYKGVNLSGYIPFYFGPRSPMLYVIQKGNELVKKRHPSEIVYLVISLNDIITNNLECVFTDGHAVDEISVKYGKEDLPNINKIIKREDVFAQFWNPTPQDPDRKRRKEAELLIRDDIPSQYINNYVVFNNKAKQKLITFGIDDSLILIYPGYYYDL